MTRSNTWLGSVASDAASRIGTGSADTNGPVRTVVVVVGGLGSLTGALVGSILVAVTLTFGRVLVPEFAGIIMYALLVAVLLFKPEGLFPARGRM